MNKTTVHIGKMIRQHLEQVGMTKSEFARRIDTSPQNIYGIFKRRSCDTELLHRISGVLNYDFFSYYSASAIVTNGKLRTAQELQTEINELHNRLGVTERENELLREIHQLRKTRRN